VLDYFKVPSQRLLVAYDELDLPPGVARLKRGGGHGGHNGMRDIFQHVADHDFLRLRIGIGHPGVRELVTPYVLSRPGKEEYISICNAISTAERVLADVLCGDLATAQKELHTSAASD